MPEVGRCMHEEGVRGLPHERIHEPRWELHRKLVVTVRALDEHVRDWSFDVDRTRSLGCTGVEGAA
jgi:hypothetical protein